MLKSIVRFIKTVIDTDCGARIDTRRILQATLPDRNDREVMREWMGR